jgi:hypothetical protein
MTLYMGIGSATFICVSKEIVLIYFTVKERIERFETEIEVSDWLKLSEKWCARARAQLAAAGGIGLATTFALQSHFGTLHSLSCPAPGLMYLPAYYWLPSSL